MLHPAQNLSQHGLKAVVIGAGIGGMAAAIRLANLGFQVTVYEGNSYPGGKLSEFEMDGFRFDAGPSLFTLPFLVEELFWISGKSPRDAFEYILLDETCRYFYEDGTQLIGYSNRQKFLQEIADKFPHDLKSVERYLAQSAQKYGIAGSLFLDRSLHDWRTWISKPAWKAYFKIPALGLFNTMHAENKKYFRSPQLVQLFDRFATYNGSSPYRTPGLLTMIPHLEHGIGAYFPKKGMYSITKACYDLARDLGVLFVFESRVDEIDVQNGRVKGVKLATGEYSECNLVVSNVDVSLTYSRLLPHVRAPRKILSQPKSSSALIFYWGINRSFDELGLHNIFFSNNYEDEFCHIFEKKEIFKDPTVYINITSKYKHDDAPAGCENWFTMINVPNNVGQPWHLYVDQARENIINKLNRILNVDLNSHICCENILDPVLIEQKTGSAQGALYGNSSNNKFAAFFRHANFHPQISGLYFCGGSVHPGGGIPLALKSAAIMTEFVKRDFKKVLFK